MPDNSLTIYHTNDLHNHNNPVKWLGSILVEENSLLLDAGDAIWGSNSVYRAREPILDQMTKAGFSAMAMGNREFHYSRKVLKRRLEQSLPILCANLTDLTGYLSDSIRPSILLQIGCRQVGIIGLTPVQYPQNGFWEKLWRFRFIPPAEALEKALNEFKVKPDLVILLSHLGLEEDKKIAKNFPQIKVIVGGHTHLTLVTPVVVNNNYILQTGCHGQFLGRLVLTEKPGDKKSDLILKEYQLIKTGHWQ